MGKTKFVGILRRVRPGDVGEPRVEHAGWKLSATLGPVDFYDLVVPAGAEVSYIPTSTDSYCLEVNHEGRKHYFAITSTSLTGPDAIEEVPPERCRPLI